MRSGPERLLAERLADHGNNGNQEDTEHREHGGYQNGIDTLRVGPTVRSRGASLVCR